MRTLLPLILLLASCSVSSTVPGTPIASCQAVWVLNRANGGYGSCFPVQHHDDGFTVATAAHVVAGAKGLHALKPETGDWAYDGELVWANDAQDLALVRFRSSLRPPLLSLRSTPMQPGEVVYAAGYPVFSGLVITQGIATDDTRASCSLAPGNSGGPILDHSGLVVGIATATSVDGYFRVYHIAWISPIEELRIRLP